MKLAAGQFRHVVTVRSPNDTKNDSGGFTRGWTNVATWRADVRPQNDFDKPNQQRDTNDGDRRQGIKRHRVAMRYGSEIASIAAGWSLLFGTRTLWVRSVANVSEYGRLIVAECEERE